MPCACAIPILMGSSTLISNAVVSVAASLGYSTAGTILNDMLATPKKVEQKTVVIPFENSEIFQDQPGEKRILGFNKDGVSVILSNNERGKYSFKITGSGKTIEELKALGNDMKERVTQQFVYNKVVSGLREKGYVMVGEKLEDEGCVHVVLRRFA